MSRAPAATTQAQVERMIRAAQKRGIKIVRLVARRDGIALETEHAPEPPEAEVADKPLPVL